MLECLEAFPCPPVHEAQLAIQRAHQHGLPVPRERQARDARAHLVPHAPAHPQIVGPHAAVHAPCDYLRIAHREARHRIPGFLQHLDRLCRVGPYIPDAHAGVEPAGNQHGVAVPTEAHAVHARRVAVAAGPEAADGLGSGDVPEEDGAVAARRGEALVVSGDGDAQHLVAVSRVSLDEAALRHGGGSPGGGAGVVKADRAV
ncbi:hypothetical protein VUR80DRAFT_5881 [Thermomyces stellatus]